MRGWIAIALLGCSLRPVWGADSCAFISAADQAVAGEFQFWGAVPLEAGGIGPAYAITLLTPSPLSAAPLDDNARRLVKQLTARNGGRLDHPGGYSIWIPPGALKSDNEIAVTALMTSHETEQQRLRREAQGLAVASQAIDLGPEGLTFGKGITITMPYDSAGFSKTNESLKVHYWNPLASRWDPLASTVNPETKTVSAFTDHFSIYQVLGSGGGIGVATADTAFGFKAVYAFPNPARGTNAVTIRVQPGLADSVSVRVYDLSGRKVHESSSFKDLGAFDDGNGLGQQFTYDHVWGVSGVGSGVYGYVVVGRKAGQADIVKKGKLAVVR